MRVEPEFLVAAAVAAVAFLLGVWFLRSRARRTRSVGRRAPGGPANLRFTCTGCSGQFTHSRRTLAAWEKGSRKFFCHACHTKWRGTRPPPPNARVTTGRVPDRAPAAGPGPAGVPPARPARVDPAPTGVAATGSGGRRPAGTGCLGVVLLLMVVPAGLAAVLLAFA